MADPAINEMVLYSQSVARTPNTTIQYRWLALNGKIVDSADAPLNNLGLFSHHDYGIGADRPAGLRIAVIGGEHTASSVATTSWPDYLQAEIRRRLKRDDVYVYNIGWPDAGPEHYIEYWKEFGRAIDPHLTIVNFVEAGLYRGIAGAVHSMSYRGKPLAGHVEVRYPVGNTIAKTSSPYFGDKPKDPATFENLRIAPARPYGFFVPSAVMRDVPALATMQGRVVEDMVEGTVGLIGCFVCAAVRGENPLGPSYRVAALRSILVQTSATTTTPKKRELAEFGARTYGWMAKNIPNVLFTLNFGAFDLDADYPLIAEMTRIEPQIEVIDMRKRLPEGTTANDVAPWFNLPFMNDKWSDAGHRAYAGMMADLIVERGLSD